MPGLQSHGARVRQRSRVRSRRCYPVGVGLGGGVAAKFADAWGSIVNWLNERYHNHLPSTPVAEMAFGKKLALATAAAGTIVAGGATVERIVTQPPQPETARPARLAPVIARESGEPSRLKRAHRAKRRTEGDRSARDATAADLINGSRASGTNSAAGKADSPQRQPVIEQDAVLDERDGTVEAAPPESTTEEITVE